MASPLVLSPEVRDALRAGRPVAALESTLIAHGLPWPNNIEAAQKVEAAVREGGAVPATVAVVEGALRVGLEAAALEALARAGPSAGKASARDLGPALASGGIWATTVAATVQACALAGIRLFATGGIGGVHRGAAESFDESGDLSALARWPVAVVSAGAKAILDLGRTLERLETLGVTVLGLGVRELPAFYHNQSGLPLEHVAADAAAAARTLHAKYDRLGERSGTLIVNPVPEDAQMPRERVQAALERALARARDTGMRGKSLTPFLLRALAEETGGESVRTNVAVVVSNARAAAAISVAYAALRAA